MKKLMMGLVLAALATAQFANADTFTDRRALLDKAKAAGNKPIEIDPSVWRRDESVIRKD